MTDPRMNDPTMHERPAVEAALPTGFHEACERERLHLSGAIQGHGALLVVDDVGRVTAASLNVSEWLDAPAIELLDRPLDLRLRGIREQVGARAGDRAQAELRLVEGGPVVLVAASRTPDGTVAIELQARGARAAELPALDPMHGIDPLYTRGKQALVDLAMRVLDYERVMYYEFVDGGDGVVRAESRRAEVYGSYLDLRFPASDIPRIARRLYELNPWRLIADAQAAPVPVATLEDAPPPDLTYADLRSSSPVHAVYLVNMGVRSSLSFPIVTSGRLSALLACHHSQARVPTRAALEEVAAACESFSSMLALEQSRERLAMIDRFDRMARTARDRVQELGSLAAAWPAFGNELRDLLGASTAALVQGGVVRVVGDAIDPARSAKLATLSARGEGVWFTSAIRRDLPSLDLPEHAGLMLVEGTEGGPGPWSMVFLRPEHVHEVTWGGKPDKPMEPGGGGMPIAPRQSFDRWVEQRVDQSRAWTSGDRLALLSLRTQLLRSRHAH